MLEVGKTYTVTWRCDAWSPGVVGGHDETFTGELTTRDGNWLTFTKGGVRCELIESWIKTSKLKEN